MPWLAKMPRICEPTMSDRFIVPAVIITTTSAKPIDTSYDTICAAARIAPRNAYFEFDAQPARITPYTPIDEIAIAYSRPALMSPSTAPAWNGITAHTANAGTTTITGATRYTQRLACAGWITSFSISFSTSAIGCSRPAG